VAAPRVRGRDLALHVARYWIVKPSITSPELHVTSLLPPPSRNCPDDEKGTMLGLCPVEL